MASVLSFPACPFDFGGQTSRPSLPRPTSSLASVRSDSTAHTYRQRQFSISSILSRSTSYVAQQSARESDNVPQVRSFSAFSSFRDEPEERLSIYSESCSTLDQNDLEEPPTPDRVRQGFDSPGSQYLHFPVSKQNYYSDTWPLPADPADIKSVKEVAIDIHEDTHADELALVLAEPKAHVPAPEAPAFRRWVSSLGRRRLANHALREHVSAKSAELLQADPENTPPSPADITERAAISRASSLDGIAGVRTISFTATSSSQPSVWTRQTVQSPRSTDYLTSEVASRAEPRCSMDSDRVSVAPALDEAALNRSRKRARKVLELLRTEEGYLADLKCLQNAYFTILVPHATALPRVAAAQACISEIIQLHEIILSELQAAASQLQAQSVRKEHPNAPRAHVFAASGFQLAIKAARTASTPQDLATSINVPDEETTTLLCPTDLAAEVANIFVTRARSFSVYEEYVLRRSLMQLDVDLQRAEDCMTDQDHALEALQASIRPCKDRSRDCKKALGIKDLLIKPVQRITRYELLLKDLSSLTPSCDDPTAHVVLDEALLAISQICHALNDSNGNTERLRRVDSQRRLQQRLVFDRPQALPVNTFGRLQLCGALYIAWRGTASLKGQYAICILFESCLIVAASKGASKYRVLLVISLAHATLEEADNGKALQCHTTPHAWKLSFECSGAMYEALLVACSGIEAQCWRDNIAGRIASESQTSNSANTAITTLDSPLAAEMRSTGKAYGRGAQFHRRASVQRAATLGPLTELKQVIIKNTQACGKDTMYPSNSLPMERSQSVMTPSHITVLAPRRSERVHLEALLVDVWTKTSLPYPGLGPKRGEYSMRASAGHVMRKLSIASITSNFSKRSSAGPVPPLPVKKVSQAPQGKRVITFHSAPEAFLPEDFELSLPAKRGRLAGLRTFTMGAERSRAAFFADAVDVNGEAAVAASLKRPSSALARRSRSEGGEDVRSGAVMSVPTAVVVEKKEEETADIKIGVRQRAKSRLVRLLS